MGGLDGRGMVESGDQCVGSLNWILEGGQVMVMARSRVKPQQWLSVCGGHGGGGGNQRAVGAGRTLSMDVAIARWC